MKSRIFAGALLWFLSSLLSFNVFASTGRLLILHSNDIHDHLRSGYIGIGGLPYLSGFVKMVRSERDDVLLLDAGDLLEKGDLLGYRTHGEATFNAIAHVGYDAITVGNHDLDFGVDHLKRLAQSLDHPLLLLNLVDVHGRSVFEPSRVIEINGIKIGLIGMLAPRKKHIGGLDQQESGRRLAAEAARLKESVHLVVALSHEGTEPVKEWSLMAPDVDVFIAGHHHETILEPIVVDETGAIIVSAGSDAHWMGHLELSIDLEDRKIVEHAGGLNLLRHDLIPADQKMVAWLEEQERLHAPDARQFVIETSQPIGWFAIARLAADAIRQKAGADIAFYHPGQIIRNGLPAGRLDLNAIFRVSAERVDPILELEMTGDEITSYMNGLSMSELGQSQWSGFKVSVNRISEEKAIYSNDLSPDQLYKVVMPEREWRRYLVEVFEPAYVRARTYKKTIPQGAIRRRDFPASAVDFVFAEVFSEYLLAIESTEETIEERLEVLRLAQGGADPNEAIYEARFVQLLSPAYYLEQAERSSPLKLKGLEVESNQ